MQTILVILGFNVMLCCCSKIPLVGYVVVPERTVMEVQRLSAWLTRSGRRMAIIGAGGIDTPLVARGLVENLT